MRQIVTGVDGDGRSSVVEERACGALRSGDRVQVETVYQTPSNPAPPRPPGKSRFSDLKVDVGIARAITVQWPPGATAGMHYTDTVDFDTVLEGSISIILDDGPHVLGAGDSVIVTGVDHGWEAGPSGATMTVVTLGTPSPSE